MCPAGQFRVNFCSQTSEKSQRTYWPKRGEHNKDEDNSLKTLNNKKTQLPALNK